MKIRTKLIYGFIVIALVNIAIGIAFSHFQGKISDASEYHTKMSLPATNLLNQIQTEYFAMEASVLVYIHGIEEVKPEITRHKSNLFFFIDQYDELTYSKRVSGEFLASTEMKERMQYYTKEIRSTSNILWNQFENLILDFEDGNLIHELQFEIQQVEINEKKFLELVEQGIIMENEGRYMQEIIATDFKLQTMNLLIITIVISIASLFVVGFIVISSIVKPLAKLHGSILDVTQGDLEKEIIAGGGDELENLASEFEIMRKKVKGKRDEMENEITKRTLELEIANTEIKQVDRLKDEFTAMISHELKTPLMPILGWAETLKEPNLIGSLNTKQTEAVNSIYTNTVNLKNLIQDILDMQKLELNKLKFNKRVFNLKEAIDKTINQFKFFAKIKNVKIVNMLKDEIYLDSDELRISQIISNLIKNAIDFVPKENGQIEVSAMSVEDGVIISVKDNGIGIKPENQEKLFKKFYQIDSSDVRTHLGTGLGLAVCKGIVDGLRGEIWVESIPNVGSEFFIKIPKHENELLAFKDTDKK